VNRSALLLSTLLACSCVDKHLEPRAVTAAAACDVLDPYELGGVELGMVCRGARPWLDALLEGLEPPAPDAGRVPLAADGRVVAVLHPKAHQHALRRLPGFPRPPQAALPARGP